MNGHVLRRCASNELSSVVWATGTALRPRQDTHDGTPALSWPVTKAVGASDGSGRSSTMEALRSPPLPSLLAGSRQVAPDGHTTEAQPLGDLRYGQALLAEEYRLGTVFVGEAVVAFQPYLPTQPVDRRAVDTRLPNDLLDGDAGAVQVDHLLALLGCEWPELRLLDAANRARRP